MIIFCVGIGGTGLSAVAKILKIQGHHVMGSDTTSSHITDQLTTLGIPVLYNHDEKNLPRNLDLLIYSEAIPMDNPERKAVQMKNIETISYAVALGRITAGKKLLAITGTHGKTTVTGMLTSIFLNAHKDPSVLIGSPLDLLGGQNFRLGKDDLFITEACEYRDNFLHLQPSFMVINTLEPDHLDYFKTGKRYYASFQKLAEKLPEQGWLMLFDDMVSKLDLQQVKAKKHILSKAEANAFQIALQIPGKHNRRNAFVSFEAAKFFSIPDELIQKGLESYSGASRRFEYKGSIRGAKLFDDYAHHPAKVQATLQAAREKFPSKNIIAIFQPHQYSRTADFFDAYTKAFTDADQVWITDIYWARDTEEDLKRVSAEKLVSMIQTPKQSSYVPFRKISERVRHAASDNTVFLLMGAGNINTVFQELRPDGSSRV